MKSKTILEILESFENNAPFCITFSDSDSLIVIKKDGDLKSIGWSAIHEKIVLDNVWIPCGTFSKILYIAEMACTEKEYNEWFTKKNKPKKMGIGND